jgi:hypothetical protein
LKGDGEMKRTCNGCKAFEAIQENKCGLGFKIEKIYYKQIVVECKPLEECPKPKTIREYIHYRKA